MSDLNSFLEDLYTQQQDCAACSSVEEIKEFFEQFLGLMFKEFSSVKYTSFKEFQLAFDQSKYTFQNLLQNTPDTLSHTDFKEISDAFFDQTPIVFSKINKDVEAIFKGDPAAKTHSEVIRSYPGFVAISAYRIANAMNDLGIKIIPRIITEIAHSKTGIDIHPGATIGSYFCIDHGTGIVIGETAEIGDWVKIYQGVTLGALSVDKKMANTKRHPTLEENVVVYANATILGGKTVIGKNSIIGGNVWIVKSVPKDSKVYYKNREE